MTKKSSDFYQRVYAVVKQIPEGRVSSYGDIAEYVGQRSASRTVGYAMNASHGQGVPAHRVVNRLGMLTGKHHFPGINLMQQLLEKEGVKIVDDQVVDFDKLRWNPNEELGSLDSV